MCRQPAIRAPFKGFCLPYSSRSDIKPGISASANVISLRPHSAREMSFTLYFTNLSTVVVFVGGVIPAQDYAELTAAGAAAIFGPGTPIPDSARAVLAAIRAKIAGHS